MLDIIMVIVCIALIVLSLLQSGKSDGFVSAFTGQNSNLFAQQKERGSELFISRLTMALGIAFFMLAIVIQMG